MKTAHPRTLKTLRCPSCQGDLETGHGETLQCRCCASVYPLVEGIASFVDRESYWGEEFGLEEMRAINALAEAHGWRTAVDALVAPKAPARARYIRDFFRADWRFLFPIRKDWRILDVGAGWGSLSAALSVLCAEVVALESAFERVRFIQIRAEEDGLEKVLPVHGDLSKPPLAEDSFDLVAMNGVVEWLGWADPTQPVRRVQRDLLRKACRLLKPGGWLYVGIENRFGISYWLGAMDHSYLRYTSLLPRPLAHGVTRYFRAHSYRTYTYSPIGYRSLLTQAGFEDIHFFGVMPTYSRPINYWPLEDGAPIKRFAQVLFSDKPDGLSWKSRLAKNLIEKSPSGLIAACAKYLSPHLLIMARRGE